MLYKMKAADYTLLSSHIG